MEGGRRLYKKGDMHGIVMMEKEGKGKRSSISVPSFMKEGGEGADVYKERDTTKVNGYRRHYDYEEPLEEPDAPIGRSMAEAAAGRAGSKVRRRRKKKKIWTKAVFCLLIVISALAGHGAARVKMEVSSILNGMNRDGVVDLNDIDVSASVTQTDDRIINILLVGADKRETWKEAGRSDSVMIATMDLKHKRLKLTSLMRDMYVEIPGYGKSKFNSAYSWGGIELLYKTIAENFGIAMDGYAVVDFAAFKTVIDTIGGVDIELTDAEHKYLTTAYKKGSVLKLKAGLNHMNGTQALAYTRIRQDAKGDFGRTERQRKVLQSIFTEIKSLSPGELTKLAKLITPEITTDLNDEEIFSYLTSVIMMGTTQIDQLRIPVDDAYTQDRINNKAVLLPDFAVNSHALYEFIYEYQGKAQ